MARLLARVRGWEAAFPEAAGAAGASAAAEDGSSAGGDGEGEGGEGSSSDDEGGGRFLAELRLVSGLLR